MLENPNFSPLEILFGLENMFERGEVKLQRLRTLLGVKLSSLGLDRMRKD